MEMNEIEWMWLAMGMYAVGCLMTSDSQRNANCGSSTWAWTDMPTNQKLPKPSVLQAVIKTGATWDPPKLERSRNPY